MYTPHLYQLICWGTFRLSPCLDYGVEYCCEHRGACNSLNYSFVQIHAQEWVGWSFVFEGDRGKRQITVLTKLDYKESWAPKNWCFWTVVLEKTLERPLDCKEFQPVHPERNQPWIFIGKTDAEAETLILWPPDAKNWLIWKDPDAGKDWRREEKGTTEDEMVGWHHRLDGHEFA